MSDVLFGQSYFLRFDPKLWQAMQPYPPLGTLYAASYLRARGYDVALFDAMLAESESEWDKALDRHRPRFAVIYEDNFNYLSKMCLLRMREAAFSMIEMARTRGCVTIVCGSDATDHAERYIEAGATFVVVGEGEVTLGEVLDRLTERIGTPFEDIAGLVFSPNVAREVAQARGSIETRSGVAGIESTEAVVRTGRRPDMKELDALPFPAWDLVDVERYRAVWYSRHGYYSMNMVTTRGCPYHCNWCAKPIWGQRYNVRSPENVVAEMRWLKETFAPDHIWFADDILGLRPGWLTSFAAQLEASDAHIPFKCLSRVDLLLRGDNIAALSRAGCQIIWVGAESGSQQILDAMEKGTTVSQIHEATIQLHANGVKVGFFLQFGYPGERWEDIEATMEMVRQCAPDDIGMSVSYPLPGTKFHARVKEELGEQQNWNTSSDLAMLYRGPFTTEFYRYLHTVLHKEFRSRRQAREIRRLLQHPTAIRSGHLRASAAMLYHRLTLPMARRRLRALARLAHSPTKALRPTLDHDAAATPSPQAEI